MERPRFERSVWEWDGQLKWLASVDQAQVFRKTVAKSTLGPDCVESTPGTLDAADEVTGDTCEPGRTVGIPGWSQGRKSMGRCCIFCGCRGMYREIVDGDSEIRGV